LFCVRANHEEVKGGDLVQLESTAAGLRRLGVEVDFSSDTKADVSSYDLVHVFNSPRFAEGVAFMENAQRQGKPVALSTIFWGKDELAVGIANSPKMQLAKRVLGRNLTTAMWRQLKGMARFQSESNYSLERRLFAEADMLLPNSVGEMHEINRVYHVGKRPFKAVRNAIDASMFAQVPSKKRENFVLSVGRIELRKNTLQLIEACHELDLSLKLIGSAVRGQAYEERCLELIKQYGFEQFDTMPREETVKWYYRARVHAIAAWYETPGLASMEAACGGCTIVSTDRGSTKEYFGDLVHYCDPFSRASIKRALQAAMTAEPSLGLRDKIMREYTWDLAAEDTLAAYKELVRA
jgi:glycosyltransferase involved in cell wall biosynthesis